MHPHMTHLKLHQLARTKRSQSGITIELTHKAQAQAGVCFAFTRGLAGHHLAMAPTFAGAAVGVCSRVFGSRAKIKDLHIHFACVLR